MNLKKRAFKCVPDGYHASIQQLEYGKRMLQQRSVRWDSVSKEKAFRQEQVVQRKNKGTREIVDLVCEPTIRKSDASLDR